MPRLNLPTINSRLSTSLVPQRRFDEEETRSILRDIGAAGIGGLQYIAGVLDKPARTVRFGLHEGLERLGLAPEIDNDPRELLAWLPFSDTVGITNRDDAVQGRDTLRYITGETPENRTWGGFGAGLAYEILTDPLTPLTLGAGNLTKAGKALKKAGLLEDVTQKGIAKAGGNVTRGFTRRSLTGQQALDLLTPTQRQNLSSEALGALSGDEALQAQLGYLGRQFGTQPAATQGVEAAISKARAGLRDSPAGAAFSRAFDKRAMNASNPAIQAANRGSFDNYQRAGVEAMQPIYRARKALQEIQESSGLDARDFDDLLSVRLEKIDPAAVAQLPDNILARATPETIADVDTALEGLRQAKSSFDSLYQRRRELGLSAPELLDEYAEYGPRRLNKSIAQEEDSLRKILTEFFTPEASGRGSPLGTPASRSRRTSLKNIPAGRAAINQLARDTELWDKLRSNPGLFEADRLVKPVSKMLAKGEPLGMEAYRSLDEAISKLGDGNLAQELSQNGIIGGSVNKTAIESIAKKVTRGINKQLKPFHEEIGEKYLAMTGDEAPDVLRQELKELTELLRDVPQGTLEETVDSWRSRRNWIKRRLNKPKDLARYIGSVLPDAVRGENLYKSVMDGIEETSQANARSVVAGESVLDMLAQNAQRARGDGFVPIKEVLKKAGFKGEDEAISQVASRMGGIDDTLLLRQGSLTIPKDLAKDLVRTMKTATGKEGNGFLGRFVDVISKGFKGGVTQPWLSFHARNRVSGAILNVVADAHDPRYTNPFFKWFQPVQDAINMRVGKSVKGAGKIKGLSPDDATATKELFEEITLQRLDPKLEAEVGGESLFPHREFGDTQETLRGAVGGLAKGYGELASGTIRGRPGEGASKLLDRGRHLSGVIEWDNRVAPYIAFRRQGYSPEAAASLVKKFQADYAPEAFTQFERGVVKRAVPFYAFSRQLSQTLAQELMERPGGLYAQMFRARDEAAGEDPLPDYLRGSAKVGEDEKNATYLSTLGTPDEILGELVRPGNTIGQAFQNTLGGVVAQLNPLFKVPLEGVTNRSFFTGKELSDTPTNFHRIMQGALGLERTPSYGANLDTAIRATEGAANIAGLGRIGQTVRTIVDPRKTAAQKALNLTTGLRYSTLDKAETQQRAIKSLLEEQLSTLPGAATFTKTYLPRGLREGLTPEQQRAWALLNSLK